MEYVLEIVKEKFDDDYKNGLDMDRSNNYLDVFEYEDENSHNQINKAQQELKDYIIRKLEENNDKRFKVYSDWCVHVVEKSFYKNILNGEG